MKLGHQPEISNAIHANNNQMNSVQPAFSKIAKLHCP